jgi:hypothetical protein
MDPSPFHERDLDDDAEEFIVGWAREYPRRDPVSLVVHVNQLPAHEDAEHLLETAVHNYFTYRAKLNRLEFRHLLKQGRTALIIGLAFLAACILTSQLLRRQAGTLPIVLSGRLDYRRLGGHVASHGNLPLRMVAAPAQGSTL